jgi:exodeoxyribonuclease VII large subunit
LRQRLGRAVRQRVKENRLQLNRLQGRRVFAVPASLVRERRQRLDQLGEALLRHWHWRLQGRRGEVAALLGRLKALNPRAILERGYSIVRRPDGVVLRESRQVAPGDPVEILLARGRLAAAVQKVAAAEDTGQEPAGQEPVLG